jgi:hypothetical protein
VRAADAYVNGTLPPPTHRRLRAPLTPLPYSSAVHWTWHQNNASEPTIADDVYIVNANPKAWELLEQRQQQAQ